MIRTACGNVRGAARPRSRSFRRVYDAIRGVGGGQVITAESIFVETPDRNREMQNGELKRGTGIGQWRLVKIETVVFR